MPTSYKQTTTIWKKDCPLTLTGYELAPVAPAGLLDAMQASPYDVPAVRLKCFDGKTRYTWHSAGFVKREVNGERTQWYRKPTLSDAVYYGAPYGAGDGARGFFQFHRGGAVSAFCFGEPHYWSAEPVEVEPVEGYSVGGRWFGNVWRFEDDPPVAEEGMCHCPVCETDDSWTTDDGEDYDECDRCVGRGSAGGGCPHLR
jgi:hypothetical protein